MGKLKNIFNPSSLSSIVRYFQSAGVTLSADYVSPPNKFQKFVDGVIGFFDKIYTYIPSIPEFDVRFDFVFFAGILPIVFDLLLQWTTSDDIIRNVFHLMDVFCAFVFLFHVAHIINADDYYWGTFVFLIISVAWFAYRIYLLCKEEKYVKPDLESMIEDLRKYYMQGIIPEYTSDLDEDKIYQMCESYDKNIMLEEISPSVLNMSFIGVLFVAILLLILSATGTIKGLNISPFFKWVIIIVGAIFLIILLFVAIMILIPALRPAFIKVRISIKNIALMLVMMLFDFIYTPVCKAFLELFYITDRSCPAGSYLPIPTSYDNITAAVTNLAYNLTCVPCSTDSGACGSLCDGSSHKYNSISPQLLIKDDILKTTGLAAVYGAIVIIIGLPILWWYIIYINRKIMWSVPAFGRTLNEKWNYITHKMKTSGTNLFYMYKPTIARWNIVIMISKLILVIITMISEKVDPMISYLSLVGYLILFAGNWVFQPYMIQFNNALDSIVAFANALLAIVPICAAYNKQLPNWFSVPLSVAICVLPIFSVFYVMIFKPKSVAGEIYDPFAVYDDEGNKIEGIIDDDDLKISSIHFITMWQLEELNNLKIQDEDLGSGSDENIANIKVQTEDCGFNIDDAEDTDFITVKANLLKERLEAMEKRIDQICDATSSEQMLTIINIACIFAALASGYFFGAIYGRYMSGKATVCNA